MSGYQNTGNWTGAQVDALLNKADSSAQKDQNLSDLADASVARTNLGLAIGSDVQGFDADTAKTDVVQTFTAKQTFTEYAETGAVLTPTSDGDGTHTVSIPLDGKSYAIDMTGITELDIQTSNAPTPPVCSSTVFYLTQPATAATITVPAGWQWRNKVEETFSGDGERYRVTLSTDPYGVIDADAELRGTS